METNLKPISPWGSVMSMLGANIRLDNLRTMIQRSMVSQMSNDRRRYDMESELARLVFGLGGIIEKVQHAAMDRYVKARPLRSKVESDEKKIKS